MIPDSATAMSTVTPMPQVLIQFDQRELEPADQNSLIQVLVSQQLSVPTLCELSLVNPAGSLAQGAPALGAVMSVTVDGELLFTGDVTAAEYEYTGGSLLLRVRGYDVLHRLRKRQTVRAFTNLKPSDLATQLVQEAGLSVDAEADGPVWQRLIQWRQSDFDLLADVCDRCGLYFNVRQRVLQLMSMKGTGDTIPLELGRNLLQVRLETNSDSVCSSVTTQGWDPSKLQLRHGEADSARIERTASTEVAAEQVGGNGHRILLDQALLDDHQADAIAQGELDRRAARGLTMSGIADGDPRLTPGTPVNVTGVATALAGVQVLMSVTHCISTRSGGYTCEVSTTPPAPRPRANGLQAVWGTVSRVDDPDGLGRVRVSLPAYADVETDWLAVISAGAGTGKGMVWLPDCKDHVLVLFSNQETAQGLIIGGMFGAGGAPDKGGVESGVVRGYSLTTPGGQRIRMDDSKKSIRLENKDGSFIEMTPGHTKLHSSADLTIEAPGKKLLIKADTIDFRRE